jgi:predicted DNA-binding transcriptional regulator YafY
MTIESKESNHERLGYRLADILARLNRGEILYPKLLAEQYKTSDRTIHRDLTQRLDFLQLKKKNDGYTIEQNQLGKLHIDDIPKFAALAGVAGMFPCLDASFIRQLLDSRASLAYASIGQTYEDASQFKSLFALLERAIYAHHCISFTYKEVVRTVEPYKMMSHRGRWYLAAVNQSKIKAYRISLMDDLKVDFDTAPFRSDSKISQQIANEENVWFGLDKEDKEEVLITVDAKVASYFQSRQLLPEQQILKVMGDGGLIVSSRMNHLLEIMPLVNYWLPHLRIISPTYLQQELEGTMRRYLDPSAETPKTNSA